MNVIRELIGNLFGHMLTDVNMKANNKFMINYR